MKDARRPSVAARALMALVRCYQTLLHGFLGYGACRFTPTCSQYMLEALARHGAIKGLGLGVWRLLRCHPFARGGYDPVPPSKLSREREDDE